MGEEEFQIVVTTIQMLAISWLVMAIAKYRWREREREGWTAQLGDLDRQGVDVWKIEGSEDKACDPDDGNNVAYMRRGAYRAPPCPSVHRRVRVRVETASEEGCEVDDVEESPSARRRSVVGDR